MTRTISEADLAALVAVRSVIADAAHHPGRAAAIAALDRQASEPVVNGCTVNVHVFADDFATVCGCGDTHSSGCCCNECCKRKLPTVRFDTRPPWDVPLKTPAMIDIATLYGFTTLEIERRASHRDYEIVASYRGDTKRCIIADMSAKEEIASLLWQSAIRRLALDLGLDNSMERGDRLAEIFARVPL